MSVVPAGAVADRRGAGGDPERFARSWGGRAAWIAYAAGVRLVNAAYDAGLSRGERAPIPIVSIGALTFGGAGKTPITRWLAAGLDRRGWKVAILSRGYRGRGGSESRIVNASSPEAERDGDEAALLAATCPGAIVVVGARRSRSAAIAHAAGATIALLDDGHQHRALEREANVLLWDAKTARAFAARPRGLGLREPPEGLGRAHLVLLVDRGAGAPDSPPSHPGVAPPALVRLALSGEGAPPPSGRVHALSGIADPESFEGALRRAGLEVRGATRFPDHHAFGREEIAGVVEAARAQGADAIAITAKDRVRSPARFAAAGFPFLVYDLAASSEDEARILDAVEELAAKGKR